MKWRTRSKFSCLCIYRHLLLHTEYYFIDDTNMIIFVTEATALWDVGMTCGKESSCTSRLNFTGFETIAEKRLRMHLIAKYLLLLCTLGTVPQKMLLGNLLCMSFNRTFTGWHVEWPSGLMIGSTFLYLLENLPDFASAKHWLTFDVRSDSWQEAGNCNLF